LNERRLPAVLLGLDRHRRGVLCRRKLLPEPENAPCRTARKEKVKQFRNLFRRLVFFGSEEVLGALKDALDDVNVKLKALLLDIGLYQHLHAGGISVKAAIG